MGDIEKFQQSAEWYLNKGVPYRRGYLLYGPPGTGKTSFTQAIAGAMNLNICYLNLSGDRIDDDGLNRALNDAPSHSIILLEDVDGIFVEREAVNQGQEGRRVTFSGLLNALDGVRSQEGRILFMTTNHREKLDPALLRPGRCDVQVELKNAAFKQMQEMYTRFYSSAPAADAIKFAQALPEWKLSMAKLQGHFLKYRRSATDCLDKVQEILKEGDIIAEMPVAEWLDRQNLLKYMPMFTKVKVFTVSEIKHHVDGSGGFDSSFTFKDTHDQMRLGLMARGDQSAKEDFQYQTRQGARRIIGKFVKNREIREQLVAVVEEEGLTGFQLKDILRDNYTYETLRDAIVARQSLNDKRKTQMEDARVIAANTDPSLLKEETEEEKLERWGHPAHDPKQLLEEVECKESIPKLEEHKIDDALFWQLGEGEIGDKLEVKVFGTLKLLMLRIAEIKEEHKMKMEQLDKDKDKLSAEDKKKLAVLASCDDGDAAADDDIKTSKI